MKRFLCFFFFSIALCLSLAARERSSLRFFDLNIWQEGTMIEGGFEALADEVARIDADFVMFSEVRNYHNTRFCDRIVAALKKRGLTYYSFRSDDSGLLSRYPILDSCTVYPLKDDHGSCYKLVTEIKGQRIAVYTAHLDYLSCAYYDVRGYDGNSWKEREPLTDMAKILEKNVASQRDNAIAAFIEDAKCEREQGAWVFIGGDFNEPSLLDWTEATAHTADHRGLAVPWTVTSMLQQNGFRDAYRTMYPNPLTHPGYTYPADAPRAKIEQLTWAPRADERDRIDYIFFYPEKGLTLKRCFIVGPKGCIKRNKRCEEKTQDSIMTPINIWPTDHKGVVAEFSIP